MVKNILIVSGSPKKNGNTDTLIEWFSEGAKTKGYDVEVVRAAFLKYKFPGCTSCRKCQESREYKCVMNDGAQDVLTKMLKSDVICMVTPMYFFGPSAQLKIIIDRMFSLYKWDNEKGTMETLLKGKTFTVIGSAFEDKGLDALERPFSLIAEYTGMFFKSLIIPNAGTSGEIRAKQGVKEETINFGKSI